MSTQLTLQQLNPPLCPPEVNITVTPQGNPVQLTTSGGIYEWPDLYQGTASTSTGNLPGYITPYVGNVAGGVLVGGPTYRTHPINTTLTFSGVVAYPPPPNGVPNGYFQQDILGVAPSDWNDGGGSGSTTTVFAVQNGWAAVGTQSLRTTTSYTGVASASNSVNVYTSYRAYASMSVLPNISYNASAIVNILSMPTLPIGCYMNISGYTSASNVFAAFGPVTSNIVTTTGVHTLSIKQINFPVNIINAGLSVSFESGSPGGTGTFDFYLDNVQFNPNLVLEPAIISQNWNFGDGSTATGPVVTHSYQFVVPNVQAVLGVGFNNGVTTYTPKQMCLTLS